MKSSLWMGEQRKEHFASISLGNLKVTGTIYKAYEIQEELAKLYNILKSEYN